MILETFLLNVFSVNSAAINLVAIKVNLRT